MKSQAFRWPRQPPAGGLQRTVPCASARDGSSATIADARKSDAQRAAFPAVVILAAVFAVYWGSLTAPFVFDGKAFIENGVAFPRIWPPASLLRTLRARPVGKTSFALNYAIHGDRPLGYHLVNVGIHACAALVLYALASLTLAGVPKRARGSQLRYDRNTAHGLALGIAVLWAVHPLQTQSVTYLFQRFESLMGMLFLLSLYCFARGPRASSPWLWYAVSVGCFLLALGTKEVAVTLPVVLLWYDRAFVASSWSDLARRRGLLYVLFAAILLAAAVYLVWHRGWYSQGGVLNTFESPVFDYALTQPGVIVHYLRLCVWPVGQCLDYAWPMAQSPAEIFFPALLVAGFLVTTAFCTFRWPRAGFLVGAFFVVLAPTSSILPIVDVAFEHRMYLPLASVTTGIVLCAHHAGTHLMGLLGLSRAKRHAAQIGLLLLVAGALGSATIVRNRVYADEVVLWEDVIRKAPHNARAHIHLGNALRESRPDLAIRHFERAAELNPRSDTAHNNLAAMLLRYSPQTALEHCRAALRINPDNLEAKSNLAVLVARQGSIEEAMRLCEQILDCDPGHRKARKNLDVLREMQREAQDASGAGDAP